MNGLRWVDALPRHNVALPTRIDCKRSIAVSPSSSSSNPDEDGAAEKKKRGRKKAASSARKTKQEVSEAVQSSSISSSSSSWSKPFPWLGREFEETFVKARDEPNPLICCYGETIHEFVPTVRPCIVQMDPDAYSSWRGLQWTPPEFARSPGTNPANVAISIARLAGRAAFIGKVGDDELGKQLLSMLQMNNVDTRGVCSDAALPTSVWRVQLQRHGKRRFSAPCLQQSAENCLDVSDVNLDLLQEAEIFHFSSLSLTTEKMASTLVWALDSARSLGCLTFFDVNLPLPFWESPDTAWSSIQEAWSKSDVIKINKVELEFLIKDEGLAIRTVNAGFYPEYWQQEARRNRRYEYHYLPEHIAPIWTDNIKLLLVTDGTHRMHYYTPAFHGDVMGTEDVIVASSTCDRTGSGDAISAAVLRKLGAQPDMVRNRDKLERALRFAISAGVISQWTTGTVRGFPTESAAQNLTQQMFPLAEI